MQGVRCRWILPLLQVGIAIWLIQLGVMQDIEYFMRLKADYTSRDDHPLKNSWDVAPAHQLFTGINVIPFLVSLPAVSYLPERLWRTTGRFLALPAVFLYWSWIGWLIDTHKSAPRLPARFRILVGTLGLAFFLLAGGAIWHSYWGHTPLTNFGAFIWCIAFFIYSTCTLFSGVREIKEQPTAA